MTFQFDPTFSLLPKFGVGFRPVPASERDVQLVAKYLGVDLVGADVQENARELSNELERQNGFLSQHLELESVCHSEEYRKSMFIRDIVANNRQSRQATDAAIFKPHD